MKEQKPSIWKTISWCPCPFSLAKKFLNRKSSTKYGTQFRFQMIPQDGPYAQTKSSVKKTNLPSGLQFESQMLKSMEGGWATPLKNMLVKMSSSSPNFWGWKFQKCLKPPPRELIYHVFFLLAFLCRRSVWTSSPTGSIWGNSKHVAR